MAKPFCCVCKCTSGDSSVFKIIMIDEPPYTAICDGCVALAVLIIAEESKDGEQSTLMMRRDWQEAAAFLTPHASVITPKSVPTITRQHLRLVATNT